MDIAYVISTQPTRFEAAAFSPDFEPSAAQMAALGYDGIELAVRDPSQLDVSAVIQVLEKHHLRVPAIGTGQAFLEEHLSFTDPDETVRNQAHQRALSHVVLASQFQALVIIGLLRGRLQPGVQPEQARSWLVSALVSLAREARARGVRIVIEPLNRYETNLLNTVSDTLHLIDEVAADNVGVLFDTFHANIEEPRIEESMRGCGERLFHVHFADSNRWAPGWGHIDFRSVVKTLREMNYKGWISAEILPKPDIPHAAEQTIRNMRPILG